MTGGPVDQGTSIGERLDAPWLAWVAAFPVVSAQLGMGGVNVVAVDVRHRPS